MGKLFFFYGSMEGGKTLRLLTTAYNFEEKGIHFLALKPSTDTREYGDIIKSRIGLQRECLMIEPELNLFNFIHDYINVENAIRPLEWLLIDESQFLTTEQVDQLAQIVDQLDINVMCYGLRTDFQSNLFPGSKRLFELADEFEEVKSRCECGRKASINARFDENGEIILDGDQVLVGGNETYKAICRKCFFEKSDRQC